MQIGDPKFSLEGFRASYHWYTPTDEELLERYEEWRDEPLFVCGVKEDGQIIWWRAPKRGTAIYIRRIRRAVDSRIEGWLKEHKDLNLWKFLTLTVSESDLSSLRRFRHDWNIFLTKLRKKYPRMRIFKVYELQKRGSVHLHALIWGIRYLPTSWILKHWKGRNKIDRPYTVRGIYRYIAKYLGKSLENTYVQAFMWYYRMRQWACNFPCPASKTNSNPKIFYIGVCVVIVSGFLPNSIKCNITSFLKRNSLYNGMYRWVLKNVPNESGLVKPEGMGAYETVAGMLKYHWYSYRKQGLTCPQLLTAMNVAK